MTQDFTAYIIISDIGSNPASNINQDEKEYRVKHLYNEYVSYNMRSLFFMRPGNIFRCPMCSGSINETKVDPSLAVQDDLTWREGIPVHDLSALFQCTFCEWWCVRECWGFYEIQSDLDYLITGVLKYWNYKTIPAFILSIADVFKANDALIRSSQVRDIQNFTTELNMKLNQTVHPCTVTWFATSPQRDIFLIRAAENWLLHIEWEAFGSENGWNVVCCINGQINPAETEADYLLSSININLLKHLEMQKLNNSYNLFKVFSVSLVSTADIHDIIPANSNQQLSPWLQAMQDKKIYKQALHLPGRYKKNFGNKLTLQ